MNRSYLRRLWSNIEVRSVYLMRFLSIGIGVVAYAAFLSLISVLPALYFIRVFA
ncbi:MAG: hypothetical protein ACFFDS_05145 [Candidatus Thorarchaeota archaeon]